MQELFKNDATRANKFHLQWKDFLVDYSKNRIDSTTVKLLLELAEECNLKEPLTAILKAMR